MRFLTEITLSLVLMMLFFATVPPNIQAFVAFLCLGWNLGKLSTSICNKIYKKETEDGRK